MNRLGKILSLVLIVSTGFTAVEVNAADRGTKRTTRTSTSNLVDAGALDALLVANRTAKKARRASVTAPAVPATPAQAPAGDVDMTMTAPATPVVAAPAPAVAAFLLRDEEADTASVDSVATELDTDFAAAKIQSVIRMRLAHKMLVDKRMEKRHAAFKKRAAAASIDSVATESDSDVEEAQAQLDTEAAQALTQAGAPSAQLTVDYVKSAKAAAIAAALTAAAVVGEIGVATPEQFVAQLAVSAALGAAGQLGVANRAQIGSLLRNAQAKGTEFFGHAKNKVNAYFASLQEADTNLLTK